MLKLYNTLTRKIEDFIPIVPGKVKMYCCGPTVYDYAHIGNLRMYIFEDILKRVLLFNNYDVLHVMNITDVGHLVSDNDEGEDKMVNGALREGKSVWEIADFYAEAFKKDISQLNILPPTIYCKATDYIKEQIEMIQTLEKKGFTYLTSDGVYFDTSKFSEYADLAKLDIEGLSEGKRVKFSSEKKNITDFALWKFSPKDKKRQMEWESPWGIGFPGWHIECSAMAQKFLGNTLDIHCGGIDHIPVHHTNERAQSECATNHKFVNYWVHGEFLLMETGKMSKSSGKFIRLETLLDEGYSPMHYRYFCLNAHYRKKLKFSFDGLNSAKNGFENLVKRIKELKKLATEEKDNTEISTNPNAQKYLQKFIDSINDDLNVTEGLAVLWETIKDDRLSATHILKLVNEFDKVFGLNLDKIGAQEKKIIVPTEILELIAQRKKAKLNKDYKLADEIRNIVKNKGYEIIDKKDEVEVKPI